MRTCAEYEILVSAFIDGRLEAADRAELMAHMEGCPSCQEYFDAQIAIHDAIAQMEEAHAPEGFTSQVMEQVRKTPQGGAGHKVKKAVFTKWKRWAALAACCGVVALGLWSFQRQGTAEQAGANQAADASISGRAMPAPASAGPADAGGVDEDPLPADEERYGDAPMAEAAPEIALQSEGQDGISPEFPEETGKRQGNVLYASTITTASPVAQSWIEEHMGLSWVSGSSYELSGEEYQELKELLESAGEAFSEEASAAGDEKEAGRYLLLAE